MVWKVLSCDQLALLLLDPWLPMRVEMHDRKNCSPHSQGLEKTRGEDQGSIIPFKSMFPVTRRPPNRSLFLKVSVPPSSSKLRTDLSTYGLAMFPGNSPYQTAAAILLFKRGMEDKRGDSHHPVRDSFLNFLYISKRPNSLRWTDLIYSESLSYLPPGLTQGFKKVEPKLWAR